MKKVISFAFCILLGAGAVWAADFKSDTTIAPGLTITAHPDRYEVRYKLPPFHEEIVETENGRFSKIVFEDDADFLDEGYDGQPALPVKSILLQLPNGTSKGDISVSTYIGDYRTINLSYPYFPAQNVLKTDPVFQFDVQFYKSTDRCGFSVDKVELSDIFHFLGTTGIAVNFTPVTYYPVTNEVSVPS